MYRRPLVGSLWWYKDTDNLRRLVRVTKHETNNEYRFYYNYVVNPDPYYDFPASEWFLSFAIPAYLDTNPMVGG